MTGYVVTRWYRAPEVILNWMRYTQTGEELPTRSLLPRGPWRLLRGEAWSWVGGWAGGWQARWVRCPRPLHRPPLSVCAPSPARGALMQGLLSQWTSGPWAASWLSCSRERLSSPEVTVSLVQVGEEGWASHCRVGV